MGGGAAGWTSGPAWGVVVILSCVLIGCGRAQPAAETQGPITFNRDIAPIVWERCARCHRPGEVGPFSVLEYRDARQHAHQMVDAVKSGFMPPWLPEQGHGEFAGARTMTPMEVRLLERWVEDGAEEGAASDRRTPPPAQEGWQLGTPDLVVELSEPYELAAGGTDVFRNFVLPIDIPATRYVRGMEVRPGNRAVVHHASIVVDRTRASRELDEAGPGPGYEGMFAEGATNPDSRALGWTPGMTPALDPPDMAWRLVRGSDLVIQLHMTPSGKPETVRPSIGFYFSSQPPTRYPIDFKLGSKTIDIPAGESAYVVEDDYTLPVDVDLLTIYPHAHYLATDLRASATLPGGMMIPLVWIRHWNFKWQDQYRYREPVALPAGTRLSMRFVYDNSDSNPRNPSHPPQRVVYGPQSADEMGDLWLRFLPKNLTDAATLAASYEENELRKRIAMTELTVKADPADARARNELGARYVEAGRLDDAVAQLREAVRLDPRQAKAHNNLATALDRKGLIAEALIHYREAIRLAPNDPAVRLSFATALDDLGQGREAMVQYERALALNPDSAEAHNNLGALLASTNRLADAEPHFLEALAIQPDYADARRNLDMLRQIAGRPAPP